MKIAIIGGGASGIATAIFSSGAGNSVTVFEKSDRILKKIHATGNGRCNLSNTSISPENYHSSSESFVQKILFSFTPEKERRFFESLGIMLCEENGRLYPYSKKASSVADALRFKAIENGVKIITNANISHINRQNGKFEINGSVFDAVVFAFGGSAAPIFGTDGKSNKLPEAFGHNIIKPRPALVAINTKENTKSLKGLRAATVAYLYRGGNLIKSEVGETQFTDYGLSGINIMQLSLFCKSGDKILLDLFKDISPEDLTDSFLNRKRLLSGRKTDVFFTGVLAKMLSQYICDILKIDKSANVSALSDNDIRSMAKLCKGLCFTVDSTLSFKDAQISLGGADLREFCPDTLESEKCSNLYCVGEALDCGGDCGGYNLHWAWATAYTAGKALNQECEL